MLSDRLLNSISESLSHFCVNGDRENRYVGNLNISFACVSPGALMKEMNDFAISSGAACIELCDEPSYVLKALNTNRELAKNAIRLGIGKFTTVEEIDYCAIRLSESVNKIRSANPQWPAVKDQELRV